MFRCVAKNLFDVRECVNNLLGGEGNSNNACGGGKDLVEDSVEVFGGTDASLQTGVDSGLARGAVGVACVD